MVRRRRMTDAQKMLKTSMRIAGLSIIAGATLVVATKKIFDEIFVEDDWSDVDWGEEDEDYGVY